MRPPGEGPTEAGSVGDHPTVACELTRRSRIVTYEAAMYDDARWGDGRERDGGGPERDAGGRGGSGNGRPRNEDPRDVFRRALDLPNSRERVRVQHRDRSYSLNDDDVRALSTIGAFRVVAEEDLGRSRGGLTTKIHALADGQGRPLCFLLTPGQAADCRQAQSLLEGLSFERLIGDRAYDADKLRDWLEEHGAEAVIPSKRNRKLPIPHDPQAYKTRHRIENLFSQVKDLTRITLRKDKTSRSYAAFVSLAFALINCQLCP